MQACIILLCLSVFADMPAALARTREGRLVRRVALRLRRAAGATSSATYLHPSGVAGVNEIALMQSRLNASTSPQTQALSSLLSGAGVSVCVLG